MAAVGYEVECLVDDDDNPSADTADTTSAVLQTQTQPITVPIPSSSTIGAYSLAINLPFEGKNYLFVRYKNLDNSPMVWRLVDRDLRPAQFTLLEVVNPKFSPNGDGVKDETKIRFSLDEPATVIYKLYDTTGNEKSEALISKSETSSNVPNPNDQNSEIIYSNINGISQITWPGLKPDGTAYPEGIYTVRLFVADSMGNISPESSQVKSIWLDLTPPSITDTISDLGSFSPNYDGNADYAEIPFGLSEACGVTITVRDENNNVLWIINSVGAQRAVPLQLDAGNFIANWDGSVNDPSQFAEKPYYIRLEATDEAGNRAMPVTCRTAIDLTQLLISRAYCAPTIFTPGLGQTTLNYHINDDAKVTVSVFAEGSAIPPTPFSEGGVRTLIQNQSQLPASSRRQLYLRDPGQGCGRQPGRSQEQHGCRAV
jgi:hypothetical protein